jgi:hypothetical protein
VTFPSFFSPGGGGIHPARITCLAPIAHSTAPSVIIQFSLTERNLDINMRAAYTYSTDSTRTLGDSCEKGLLSVQ